MAVPKTLLLSVALTLTAVACSAVRDPRGAACGFADEPFVAQFEMAHARHYRSHLPRMGRSPELEHDGPAFVVVFPGRLRIAHFGGYPALGADGQMAEAPRRFDPVQNVVCVIVGGTSTIYTDVDLTGLNYLPIP